MTAFLRSSLVIGLLFGLAQQAPAQAELKAVIDKAIKAHGGADKLNKFKAIQTKAKGKLEILNGIDFTQESTMQLPDKLKDVLQMEIMGQNVTVTTVFDGKKVYINANGQAIPITDAIQNEIKEVMQMANVMRMVALTEKGYELASLGEIKVNDCPAIGIRVSKKGQRDANLYFDKENGLAVKVERRGVDPMSGQEFTEERFITDYQDKDGMKIAKKVSVLRDGKKYMEAEVLEIKFLDKVDDSEFKEP